MCKQTKDAQSVLVPVYVNEGTCPTLDRFQDISLLSPAASRCTSSERRKLSLDVTLCSDGVDSSEPSGYQTVRRGAMRTQIPLY